MNTVEVPSTSRDLRRLVRAAALLLTGAAVHLWLFPVPVPPGQDRLLDRLEAGVRTLAREGAVATSGQQAGVIIPALGAVRPHAGARNRVNDTPTRVRVLIETVHPASAPSSIIPSRPVQLANVLFTAVRAPEAPIVQENDVEEVSAPSRRPGSPTVSETAVTAEFEMAARAAAQPPPPPIPVLAQPPTHIARAAAHRDLPGRLEMPSDERLVGHVLQQYRQAYESLDVSAAQTVWPTVDARALGAAFRQLAGQRVTFDSCGVSVSGSGSEATARCTGQAEYVPKVGSRRTYTASGEWVFDLQKENAAWRITHANASLK